MGNLKETKFLSCEHNFTFLKAAEGQKRIYCSRCEMIKTYRNNVLTKQENPPLADLLAINPKDISKRTNLKKRRIVFSRIYETEYFAKKLCAGIAFLIFQANPNWEDVWIEVPFKNGFVQCHAEAKYFQANFDDFAYYWSIGQTTKTMVENFAKRFCVSRLSRYVPPGSKFESILAQITKNKRFI